MTGHGEKLTRKQESAIVALLAAPTIAAAARQLGVGEKTLRRWLQLPAFKDAYRAARRELVEGAVGQLQAAAGKAVETLVDLLGCSDDKTKARAALGIIDRAVKGSELGDALQRIEALEALVKKRAMQ